MLSLLHNLDPNRYTHRSYVISSGDEFSAGRAREFEGGLVGRKREREKDRERDERDESGGGGMKEEGKGKEIGKEGTGGDEGYSIHTVPRARSVHQSLLSTPLTSLHCLYTCLLLLHNHPHGYPDLILTNGPATSLILILASTILRFFALGTGEKMRTIYIESWARVKRPSLSGRIIVYGGLCNRVLVQWKGLEERGWGEYRGPLVR